MFRIHRPTVILAIVFIAAACGGGTATSAPQSQAPASPASAAPGSQAPASAPAAGAACAPSDNAGSVAVKMANFAFDPATVTAKVGDTITWTNTDSTGHTATIKGNDACTTPTLAKDATGSITFSQAGTYDFFCKIHPTTMTGTITVS
jgi:plastocyanin